MSVSVAASIDTSAAAAAGPQLPPEIAELGTPDEVFDLAASKHSSQTILALVLCLVMMVVCLGMGGLLVTCGIKPFGTSPPPLWVCFGIGGPCLLLAMGTAYGAYYFEFESRAGLEVYHLFPDALAVLGPSGTRLIAWDRIGPQKPVGTMNPQHVFPVEGESDIRFDHQAAMHEALEMAITHRSTKARWTRLLTPAAAQQLSATETSPSFLAHDPADRGLYRVSRLGGRLLFARLADGCATGTRGFEPATPPVNTGGLAGGVAGGLAGGYVAWKQSQQLAMVQAVIDRFDGIDDRQLFDLAAALPGSRLLAVEDVSAPELAAPAMWEKMSTGAHLVATLKFQGAEWGDMKLYLESRGQVGQAAEILQGTLHADLRGAALGAVV